MSRPGKVDGRLQNNLAESAKVCKEEGTVLKVSLLCFLTYRSNHGGIFKGRCKVQIVEIMYMQQEVPKQLWIGAQG